MIYSFSPFGYEGSLVNIEVYLRRGIPSTDIVGLSDACVAETRERVISAIRNTGLEYPPERVMISLSPADLRKEGQGFDLPIALSILYSKAENESKITHSQDNSVLVMGELELSGKIRSVRGVYSALQTAVSNGIKYAIIPKDSEKEPQGILCYRAENLEDAFNALMHVDCDDTEEYFQEFVENQKEEPFKIEFEDYEYKDNFDAVEGHNGLKMAMAVAVAGSHNLIAIGSPGCGKTMMLQMMPLLIPKLLPEEQKSVNRIWYLAGITRNGENITTRPFRMPHQTASIEGICGGGTNCRPGEISLAHNGVLFLDEAPEFRSSVLQMLRVPLENGTICLSRAGRSTVYPAKFQLVMATAPCPCGNYGSKNKICLCSAKSIEQYWMKFSAPLLDRIGIRFDLNMEKDEKYEETTLEELRGYIKTAWERQYARQGKLNQDLAPSEVIEYIHLKEEAQKLLDKATDQRSLSPRAVSNIKKMAQTVFDMFSPEETSGVIGSPHIQYALKLYGMLPSIY